MNTTKPSTSTHDESVANLLSNISQGKIKLPRFQRDFVWTVDASAALIDSILKGYPIGALIFWLTSDRLREVRSLGRMALKDAPEGTEVNYVLDGQQRLTSIYAALHGVNVTLANNKLRDFSNIWVDLAQDDPDEPIVVTSIEGLDESRCVRLSRLFSQKLITISKELPDDTHDNVETYVSRLKEYRIPYMQLSNAPISVATEVFSRVNVGGKPLTLFEIMVARTYDPDRNFDLGEKWHKLNEELGKRGYETIEAPQLMQLCGLIHGGDARAQKILDIPRQDFIETWPQAEEALKHAVDFCRAGARLPISRLLPYVACIVPIAYFYRISGGKPPSAEQSKALIAYVIANGLASRYSSSVETKLNQDSIAIKKLFETGQLTLDAEYTMSVERLISHEFRAGEAVSKTIVALLARKRPVSFRTNAKLMLDNAHMQLANSRNFHHVFPKAFLRKQGLSEGLSENSMMNISLVDDFINKRQIRARAPSDYFEEFAEENEDFEKAMKTHLISVEDGAAIWKDDYQDFLKTRAKKVMKEIRKVLEPLEQGRS